MTDLEVAYDARHGGFSPAPKFPRPSEILFLLREWARTGNRAPLEMATATLQAMARGGMRDHVGGGFHRYSVDERWRVPHFEKMLYDQAQLALAYLEGAQAAGSREFVDVAAETLAYVERDLMDAGGGFYSAEDADSLPAGVAGAAGAHKSEGAFYLWTDAEIAELAGADAPFARERFGIQPGGNAPHDPHGEFAGRNVLYLARPVEQIARDHGLTDEDVRARLERVRRILFDQRELRPRPSLDDKVLASWNGLAIGAFARASRVLPAFGAGPRERWLEPARRAARFVRSAMWDAAEGRLLRRYRDGEAAIAGYADDYACLAFGLVELFQADGDPQWLEWAFAFQARLDERFLDEAGGGWFGTDGKDRSVILRLKEDYDGAEPAATSVTLLNLLALGHLAGGETEQARLSGTFKQFATRLRSVSRALPLMLAALSAHTAGLQQVVVVGPDGRADTETLLRALNGVYRPFTLQVPVDPGRQPDLARPLPWVGSMAMQDGQATAYVCRDFACQAPTTDPTEMLRALALSLGPSEGTRRTFPNPASTRGS